MSDCYDGLDIIVRPEKSVFVGRNKTTEKLLNLTSEKVRNQLLNIGFYYPYTREEKEEYFSSELENYGIPAMNFIYYWSFHKRGKIPSMEEFFDDYIKTYCDVLDAETIRFKKHFDSRQGVFKKKHLIGRLFRAYYSFHREIDLLYQFAAYDGIDIQYSFKNDRKGIDFIIQYKGNTFGIASYVGSKKSNAWKEVKNNTRHDYSQIHMIDMVAHFFSGDSEYNCELLNGIAVYSRKFVASKFFEIVRLSEERKNEETNQG